MEKEMKVYLLTNPEINRLEVSYEELSDDDFKDIVEKVGMVFTLKEFETEYNNEDINTVTSVIRFIKSEKSISRKTEEEDVPMEEIYRIMHKRMKHSPNSEEIFDILQEIKFPEDYK
jgi:hypothetical protein